MDKLLLDTNILIKLVRGDKTAELVKEYVGQKINPQLFISIVTIAEAESLTVKWGWGDKKIKALRELIDSFICIDITRKEDELMNAYVAIDAYSQGKKPASDGENLNDSSRNMGKNDVWIATTASALNAELITTDSDFDHLGGKWLTLKKF